MGFWLWFWCGFGVLVWIQVGSAALVMVGMRCFVACWGRGGRRGCGFERAFVGFAVGVVVGDFGAGVLSRAAGARVFCGV